MAGISYEDLFGRLSPEALSLLREMVAAHLESSGDRMFIRASYLGQRGESLLFTGDGSRRSFDGIDGGAIEDLAAYGLLHVGYSRKGTPNYRVGSEALAFYRWIMEQEGTGVAQVEEQVQRVIEGDAFAQAHPGAAHHLREAFALLWSGRTDDQVVSEVGDHLRKAIMDLTTDLIGGGGDQERPIARLTERLNQATVSDRERAVLSQLVELARVSLRLDHRLNHIRDEADQGEPPATWEEVRRAAFATSLVCYELSRAL